MNRSPEQLRMDALAIWQAGVDAVKSERLVADNLQVDGDLLCIEDEAIPLDEIQRIVVVGAGKAGAGMAIGVEQALGEPLCRNKQLTGWVNVPADCISEHSRPQHIRLHPLVQLASMNRRLQA